MTPTPGAGQEFIPPENTGSAETPPDDSERRFRFGIFGVGARVGFDLTDRDQGFMSTIVDMGDLVGPRVRLRSLAEISFGSGLDNYQVGSEIVFRFLDDSPPAVPYFAFGLSVFGQQQCQFFSDCPALYGNFSLGFEMLIDGTMAWMIEYRGEDLWRRNRLMIGVTSRRGR